MRGAAEQRGALRSQRRGGRMRPSRGRPRQGAPYMSPAALTAALLGSTPSTSCGNHPYYLAPLTTYPIP